MKVKIAISEPPEVIDPFVTDLAACIARSKRALVVTGAGISCTGGIPDFRSADGLYNLVKKKHPKVVLRGAELFDAMLFRDEKRIRCFYTFMAELKKMIDTATPTPTHTFIRSLNDKGQLMRCYTQNIDCLEEALDLPVVQLHGTMNKVKCTLCSASYSFTADYENQFREGDPPACPKCESVDSERARLGKRQLATGTLRPDIVLYNEAHPHGETIGQLQVSDLKKKPDLMIIMGTSLKIAGVKKFIKQAARAIHSTKNGRVVFVNKTPATKEWDKVFDYEVIGSTDEWVKMTELKLEDQQALAAARLRLKRSMSDIKEEIDENEKENAGKSRAARTTKRSKTMETKTTQTTLSSFCVTKRNTMIKDSKMDV
ncbi:hypothetical protein DFQ28_009220 [Apophysomyces sp. BC1034]|nr:hypothetical protein DFQ30_008924 [Apophysomyces sp. BC1015]KAG0173567.1 hypothetical protein DFQ29_007905 [Apophysomyces sp. BC1021]KAG0185505.1 hypothetical protein DFQ28_009220 [Apophysomyces sp. BC1034]